MVSVLSDFLFSVSTTINGVTGYSWGNILNWSLGSILDSLTGTANLGTAANTVFIDGTYGVSELVGSTSNAFVSIDSGGLTVQGIGTGANGPDYGGAIGVGGTAGAFFNVATTFELNQGLTVNPTGTVSIESGSGLLDVLGSGASTINGTVDGPGTLLFGGGNVTLGPSADLAVPALTLGAGATLQLAGNVSYAGTLASAGGMQLHAHTLTLTGSVATISAIGSSGDAGRVIINGPTAVGAGTLTVGGNDVLEIAASGTQLGNLQLGISTTDIAELQIDSGISYLVDGALSIEPLGSADLGSVLNDGSLIVAAGTGEAALADTLVGTGVLDLTSGVLNVAGSIAAGQSIDLANATTMILQAPSAVSGAFTTFASGATLELANTLATIEQQSFGTGSLGQVTLNAGTTSLVYDVANNGTPYVAVENGGNTFLTVGCFVSGTRIMTAEGARAVESLGVGTLIATTEGLHPVTWLGRRHINLHRHPEAAPIRVRAGAFAPDQPQRDLWLSPDHAVLQEGALVPIRCLVNGATIARDDRAGVTYFHVELTRHAVLFAEGLPAESYLDTGNRTDFEGGATMTLRPAFTGAAERSRALWQAGGCARLLDGAEATAPRARLTRRAEELGYMQTDDPALAVMAGERRLVPCPRGYAVPPGTRTLRLCSRSAVPSELDPAADDRRRLGVAVRGAWFDGAPAGQWLGGAYPPEDGLVWTQGDALLAVPEGARHLRLDLGNWQQYWREPRAERGRVAPGVGLEPTTERLTAACSTS